MQAWFMLSICRMMLRHLLLLDRSPSKQQRGMLSWHSSNKRNITTTNIVSQWSLWSVWKSLKRTLHVRKEKGEDHRWLGPYVIIKDQSKGFFSLQSVESGKIINEFMVHTYNLILPHQTHLKLLLIYHPSLLVWTPRHKLVHCYYKNNVC